jgi:hypothetical protein
MTDKLSTMQQLQEDWKDIIEADGVEPIANSTIRNNVIRLLENQVKIGGRLHEMGPLNEDPVGPGTTDGVGTAGATTNSASARNWDPILIQLVRRTQPSLIANRLMGVQPMSGPTGLIFSMKAHATDASGNSFGTGASQTDLYAPGTTPNPDLGGGTAANPNQDSMTTAELEALGSDKAVNTGDAGVAEDPVFQTSPWAEVSFTIDQMSVTAQGKALKARYTVELAHDLKQVHGLDADTELSNILSGELVAELNREVVNTLFTQAVPTLNTTSFSHASAGGFDFFDYTGRITTEGTYDLATDSDGRWEGEHFRNLVGMINRVAHEVALGTRRGLGNVIITDPITASAIDSAARTTGPADNPGGLEFSHDNVGVTYAGMLLGRYAVFVDPYMTTNEVLVGYKGANVYDAGYFYCPYVPLTVMRTVGEDDFQPRIGFKTRYGMVHNPFTTGTAGENWYYRKFVVAGV